MNENEVAQKLVDAAYTIHIALGSGLLESAYQAILVYELQTGTFNQLRRPVDQGWHQPHR